MKEPIKRDCYMYDRDKNECPNLDRDNCEGCTFYCTLEQHLKSCAESNRILREKPEHEQLMIADKYYGGKMPWRTGGGCFV